MIGDNPAPRRWRARIFSLTWLSYFSYYQTRKNVSFVKAKIVDAGIATKYDFAGIETAYSTLYAIGQFVWGVTADRLSARKMLAIGMVCSAFMSFLFGLTDAVAVMAIAFGLNGLAQSTGWPGNGRITASWFGTQERGVVLGWWGTCYQVGPFVAAAVAPALFGFGWRWALFGPALWVVAVAIAIYLFVVDTPADAGFHSPDGAGEFTDPIQARLLRKRAWRKMLRSRTIWLLGASYFCIKLTRYSLWFWLPYYFEKALHFTGGTPAYMSMALDAGGVVGVIASGYLADRLFKKRRVATAALLLVCLAGALWLYNSSGATSVAGNVQYLALIGTMLFGADALISGAAAQDAGGPHAAAAACGMVNGLGSCGQIAQGYVTAYVSSTYGWHAMFQVFLVLALVGAAALIPLLGLRPSEGGD